MAIPGTWYQIEGTLYVNVNKKGTVEKIEKPRWWKVLLLAFAQLFGLCKTVCEIKNFINS